MAQLPEDLLQEIQAFLGGPLAEESAALSAACEQQRKCLLRKLLSIAVGAATGLPCSAVYLDMNGVKSNNRNTPLIDTMQRNSIKENLLPSEDVVDNPTNQSTRNNGPEPEVEDFAKSDSCAACAVCTGCENLFPCEDSQLLATDSEEAEAWLNAIRYAGCHSLKSKLLASTHTDTNTRNEERAPSSPSPAPNFTTNGPATSASHSEAGDIPKPQTPQPQPSEVDAQQYEPMSSDPDTPPPPPPPPDDIYHDIAPPSTPPPSPPNQPEYENGTVALQGSSPKNDTESQQERPVYDDVGLLHLYKNVPSPALKPEIVYDDVGMLNGLPTQGLNAGSLYELIDDNSTPCSDGASS